MDKELQIALLTLSPVFIKYLDSLRNKNPLKGSDGGKNSNSVFCEIGKNLIVDTILEAIEEAKNPKNKTKPLSGSDIMSSQIQ